MIRNLLLLFFTVCVLFTTKAQQSEYQEIEKTIGYYLDGLKLTDHAILKKAFHEKATMKFVTSKGYQEVNVIDFFSEGIKAGLKTSNNTGIVDIGLEGNAANVRLNLDYGDVIYTDFLNLLKIDGEWKIVNKIFYQRME